MNRIELGKRLFDISHLTHNPNRADGLFLLRSGQISDEYFDKYQFESDAQVLRDLVVGLSTLTPLNTEMFAGLTTGGIPLSTGVSLVTGLPQVIVRSESKAYGTEKQIEGIGVAGKNVCIVEDVVTTGGKILEAAEVLRNAHANVEHIICAVERTGNARKTLADAGLTLRAYFTQEELEDLARHFIGL